MIREYFQQIEFSLASYTWARSVQVLRHDILETDWEKILVYRIRVSMAGGGILEIRERVVVSKRDGEKETTTYSFHWQNQKGKLIKRWDNAPHFPDIDGFPCHIHIGENNTVVPGRPINALEMLAMIDMELTDVVERE
ncbi:MAG: hypothetical protein ISS63_02645 [Desulfobacteraceae bacterium]|nr:hypothetical protein [Desulfobacteraceae bacterium]